MKKSLTTALVLTVYNGFYGADRVTGSIIARYKHSGYKSHILYINDKFPVCIFFSAGFGEILLIHPGTLGLNLTGFVAD